MRGVYEIRNVETGEIYLGSSQAILARWDTHIRALSSGQHPNLLLQAAWNRYGPKAFSFRILEVIKEDEDQYEQEYALIRQLNPAYNIGGTLKATWSYPKQKRTAARSAQHPHANNLDPIHIDTVSIPIDANTLGLVQCPCCDEYCLLVPSSKGTFTLTSASQDRLWSRVIALYLTGHLDQLIFNAVDSSVPTKTSDDVETPLREPQGERRAMASSGFLHFMIGTPQHLPLWNTPVCTTP